MMVGEYELDEKDLKNEDGVNTAHWKKTEANRLIDSLSEIRWIAMSEEEKLRLGHCRYKWELGIDVYKKLSAETHIVCCERYMIGEAQNTIMGIPFEVNGKDKDVIRLWREVKA